MVYALFLRRLGLIVLCILILAILVPLRASPHSVFAQTTLTVERVWTRNGNDQDQTSFAIGDAIHYWVQVNNSSGNSIQGLFHYEAFLGTINNLNTENFDQILHNVTVPVGITSFDAISTVPNNAQLGAYTIRVRVGDQNSSSSDVRDGQFVVTGTPTPSPTQPPTPNPTTPTTPIPTTPPTEIPTVPSTLIPGPTTVPPGKSSVSLSQSKGIAGSTPVVFGIDFPPNSQITIQWFPPGASNGQNLKTASSPVIANENGNFNTLILIPQNSPVGKGMVCALDAQITACTSFIVIPEPPLQAPEINSVDVGCEALLFAVSLFQVRTLTMKFLVKA